MPPEKSTGVNRNESIDYLRGLAATGVMAYHMQLLSFGETDASDFLAKAKIYAVAIFYVLSGLTLYIANQQDFSKTKEDILNFFLKRFFRIFPLMWLATFLTYLMVQHAWMYSPKILIVNILIFPGAFKPDGFVANGAWSIGNELFFYLFFPLLFFLYRAGKHWMYLVSFVILIPFMFFAYKVFDPAIQLGHQWSAFVNPLNQFFFFAMGVLMAGWSKPSALWQKWALLPAALLFTLMIFYPVSGEPVALVIGNARMVLSALTILICYFFYISDLGFLPDLVKRGLKFLGDASFSIYLLHPLVFTLIVRIMKQWSVVIHPWTTIGLTVICTLLLSNVTYNRFEKYFMRLGKNLISKRKAMLQ